LTSIWRSNDICTRTKVRLYKTLVLAPRRPGHWRRRKFKGCGFLRWQFCGVSGMQKRPAQKCGCSEGAWCHSRGGERGTAQTTLILRSRRAHVAISCVQPLTLQPSRGYKTTRATKKEIAGRFARGFQDCRHHPTASSYCEGPTVVESHGLSAGRPVRCVVVTDALRQVKSSLSLHSNYLVHNFHIILKNGPFFIKHISNVFIKHISNVFQLS